MKRIICLVMLVICLASCSDEPSAVKIKTEDSPLVYTFNTSYVYQDSSDPIKPSISLNVTNNRYSFTYSGLSSHMPVGEFEITDGRLYLWTDESKTRAYVFDVTDKGYVFDADSSEGIPTYKVSGYSDERYSPVPDGALFEPAHEEGEIVIPLTNGWVKKRGELESHNLSEEDLRAVSDIIEGREWTEGLSDCATDCQLYVGGLIMSYHSSCGTLNMVTPSHISHKEPEGKSLNLSDEETEKLNAILEKYVTLGWDVIE